MDAGQSFTTDTGERYTWTAGQIEAYRAARSGGADEPTAIAAGHAGFRRAGGAAAESVASATEIYDRRAAVYAAAGRQAALEGSETPRDVVDPPDVYARRERVQDAFGRGKRP
jgi:hypothetical protein